VMKMVEERYLVYETDIKDRKLTIYANPPKEKWGYHEYRFFRRLLDSLYIASGIWIVPKEEKGLCDSYVIIAKD